MNKRIVIYVGEDVTMAHMPSGQVKFLTFFQFLKLAWYAVKNDIEITVEDKP